MTAPIETPPAGQGEHLTVETTPRGFDHYPPIPGAYGGTARVYESSAASSPHVWLAVTDDALHLTAENATKLAEQLLALVANHYQNEGEAIRNETTAAAQLKQFVAAIDAVQIGAGSEHYKHGRATMRDDAISAIQDLVN